MNEKYIQALRDAIQRTHGCASRYISTTPIKEEHEGRTVWDGDVEVFDLAGHPKASQCYAWGFLDDAGKRQYVAILRLSPVDTPRKAVQAYIVSRKNRTP